MLGKIIKNWNAVDFRNPDHLKKFVGAFQAFMQAPDNNLTLKNAIQQFSTKGDFPDEVLQILEKFHAQSDFDLGYEQIFDIRPFQGTTASGFDILSVTSGLTFSKVKPGGKAKVYKMSGAKTSVTFDLYGGGLQWDRTLMDDKKYWEMEDFAIEFRNKAYTERAANFYALVEAISSTLNITWQSPTPSTLANTTDGYTASRDANTIEAACLAILTALKNSGLSVNPNSEFVCLAPVALRPRIQAALTRLAQPVAGATKQQTYNVRPVYTMMLSSQSSYYVCLPKRKAKGGYRMDLTLFNMFQILEYADLIAGWMRYGGAIGETNQFRRCATS